MKHLAAMTLSAFALVAPAAGMAHPHIFIETGLAPVFGPDGRLEGIEVAWRYDELYSLLVLEDMELDDDYDGVLKPEELARLQRFDLQWDQGFEGDLYIRQGETALRLGPPKDRGTAFENGQITSRHFRAVEGGTAGAPWLIQAYDPTYYTAYDLGLGVTLPDGCRAEIAAPDLDAADRALQAELARIPADAISVEQDFPAVGAVFAERIVLTCAAGS